MSSGKPRSTSNKLALLGRGKEVKKEASGGEMGGERQEKRVVGRNCSGKAKHPGGTSPKSFPRVQRRKYSLQSSTKGGGKAREKEKLPSKRTGRAP